jgi:hypothetical protein
MLMGFRKQFGGVGRVVQYEFMPPDVFPLHIGKWRGLASTTRALLTAVGQ